MSVILACIAYFSGAPKEFLPFSFIACFWIIELDNHIRQKELQKKGENNREDTH
jgi:hypothetical protein